QRRKFRRRCADSRTAIMNFDFSEEQELFREQLGRLFKTHGTMERLSEQADAGGFDRALWEKLAETGALGATIAESHGGLGLGYLEACIVAEEAGRGIAAVPY